MVEEEGGANQQHIPESKEKNTQEEILTVSTFPQILGLWIWMHMLR